MSLPRLALLQYGFLALPLAFAGMPLYVHAPDLYASHYGISLTTIGFVLLGLRFFDAVQDPLIGALSDRYARYRYPMMAVAGILLVASFTALFNPIDSPSYLIWFMLSMLVATSAFSVLGINLNTLGGLWSKDSHQKTRITSWREAFGLMGLLAAVILPTLIGFFWVSVLLAILMLIALWLFCGSPSLESSSPSLKERGNILHTLRTLPKQTRQFFGIYALSMLASSIPAILVMFYIRDRLDAEILTGVFLLLYFLSGALAMPLWQFISKKYGKYQSWLIATFLAVFSFIWAYFLGTGDILQYMAICMLSGIAFGADLALPPSILADHIQEHDQQADASLQFGLFAFLAKLALAVASAITFPLLDASGFTPAQENSEQALHALSLAYAAIPCLIKLGAAVLLWRHTTHLDTGESHDQNPIHPHTYRSHPHA